MDPNIPNSGGAVGDAPTATVPAPPAEGPAPVTDPTAGGGAGLGGGSPVWTPPGPTENSGVTPAVNEPEPVTPAPGPVETPGGASNPGGQTV